MSDLNTIVIKGSSNQGERMGRHKVIPVKPDFEGHTYSKITCLKRSSLFNRASLLESAFRDHSKSRSVHGVLKQPFPASTAG